MTVTQNIDKWPSQTSVQSENLQSELKLWEEETQKITEFLQRGVGVNVCKRLTLIRVSSPSTKSCLSYFTQWHANQVRWKWWNDYFQRCILNIKRSSTELRAQLNKEEAKICRLLVKLCAKAFTLLHFEALVTCESLIHIVSVNQEYFQCMLARPAVWSPLLVEEEALLASLRGNLQLLLGCFAAGMRIGTSRSEAVVHGQIRVDLKLVAASCGDFQVSLGFCHGEWETRAGWLVMWTL